VSARIFVGLAPDAETAEEIAGAAKRVLGTEKWRLYGGCDIHLTLCFLGEVDREAVGPLASALGKRCEGLAAPALEIAGLGAFPDERHPRVVWAGVRAEEEEMEKLRALAREVAGTVSGRGLPFDDKPLVPHLTLARPRGRVRLEAGPAALDRGWPWRPTELLVFESVGGAGERYPRRPVARLRSD
jgi:2'-5' RNA ligase